MIRNFRLDGPWARHTPMGFGTSTGPGVSGMASVSIVSSLFYCDSAPRTVRADASRPPAWGLGDDRPCVTALTGFSSLFSAVAVRGAGWWCCFSSLCLLFSRFVGLYTDDILGCGDWETKRPRFVLIARVREDVSGRTCLGGRVWEDVPGRTCLGDETILFRPHGTFSTKSVSGFF